MLFSIMSFLPIIALLILLLAAKLPASKAGAISFLIALVVCLIAFKPGLSGLAIILGKGFGLALFVVFIIWGAMFLYHLVREVGALEVINQNIQLIIEDRYVQFLMLSWVFAPFLQGIAGFGVPVIVVTPIMIAMGFDPILSAASVLIGHSWSISFGSMGSSIYAIDMVTSTAGEEIVPYMAIYGAISMVIIGFAITLIYGGTKALKQGFFYVLIPAAVMACMLYALASLQMFSVIGLLTGISGLVSLYAVYRIRNREKKTSKLYRGKLSLAESVLPYVLIVVLSIVFFVLSPKLAIHLQYPEYTTLGGITVDAEPEYVNFNLLKYPFCIILFSSLLSMPIYRKRGCFDMEKFKTVMKNTVNKCVPTSITLALLLCMAQVMMDSGMISQIADVLVAITGSMYPIVSPFIGLLGAFITGSNTNSNVLFGNLQELAAQALALPPAIMCAAQSIGASVGGAIGPTTVALGATSAQMIGEESKIYRLTLLPVIGTVLVLGIVNFLLLNVL